MSDLTTLTDSLAGMKTTMYNRLVAQGDTTITSTSPMQTMVDHYENLVAKASATLNVTENGTYTASTSLISGYGTINVNVPAGGPATKAKYKIGDRVYDSSNNDIGVVYSFYIDGNGVEYAVVCLNAEHRFESGQWAASTSTVTNMPLYSSVNAAAFGNGTETATANCDLISAFTTSTGVSNCRSKSFTIDGTTYYGQMPNICELLEMFAQHYWINANDPTASSAGSTLNFASWKSTWSSSQNYGSNGWYVTGGGSMSYSNKTSSNFVAPVLEIPNRSNS